MPANATEIRSGESVDLITLIGLLGEAKVYFVRVTLSTSTAEDRPYVRVYREEILDTLKRSKPGSRYDCTLYQSGILFIG